MAIQIPNPGTGNGATGDNEFVLWSKVKDNFSNATHAASKLVGNATGQIPLAQDVRSASAKVAAIDKRSLVDFDLNTMQAGDFLWLDGGNINSPFDLMKGPLMSVESLHSYQNGRYTQLAVCVGGGSIECAIRGNTSGTQESWSPWAVFYSTGNTTKDSNGFIKAASPIVKVFADKAELNGESEDQDVTYIKNGVGDYTITTVSGLSTDGWYIELPKDMNGNPKVAVTLSEVDGVISLKSYKRIFSMETFTFEPDLDNPLDIPEGRWIDLRLNEIPVENVDDIQTEV